MLSRRGLRGELRLPRRAATGEAKERDDRAGSKSRAQGTRTINFKLRDWLFSRQRYWGEPFPIVWENGRHAALPETALPVTPPELEDFKPERHRASRR